MKILFLTPQLPYPPSKGTAIRNFNIIKNLAEDHEIWVLSFLDEKAANGELPRNLEVLGHVCRRVETVPMPYRSATRRLVSTLLSPKPDLAWRLASPQFEDRLVALLNSERFDVIQIEGLEMAELWRLASKRARLIGTPLLVLDEHNAEFILQRRAFRIDLGRPSRWMRALYSWIESWKLRRYEAAMCGRMDGVVTVSEQDREQILRLCPEARVEVVPNGVDVGYFDEVTLEGTPLGDASIVFTGTMDFRPNVDAVGWFATAVWPHIIRQVPEARFYIVGRSPKPEVMRLEQIRGVVVTGAVRDIRPFMTGAALSVVPIRVGGGSRLKILEAMAAGTPLVSTTLGAEGIDATPGVNIVIADRPEDFAREVVDLLGDPARREALAAEARRLVANRYDWPAIVPTLDKMYRELAERAVAAAAYAT